MTIKTLGAGLVAATLALTAFPVAVQAGSSDETVVRANIDRPTAQVSYADINLRSDAGVNELNARVRRAANRLCVETGVKNIKSQMFGRSCRNAALDRAAPQIAAAVDRAGSTELASAQRIVVTLP